MLLKIHPENPEQRKIKTVVECLNNGGVIIYPTDTIYGLGCDIYNQKAVEKLCRIKGLDIEKATLSILCDNFSQLSDFTVPIDNMVFRVMKKALPGPFTFILKANNKVPSRVLWMKKKKKTVAIRIPDHKVPLEIVKLLGNPIITTSLRDKDIEIVEVSEVETDPAVIYEKYSKLVDIVIDSGLGGIRPSTIVDCSDNEFKILRQGAGDLYQYL